MKKLLVWSTVLAVALQGFVFESPLFPVPEARAANTVIRQEINILDGTLTATSGNTATSSEIVLLDLDKYNGATYYFEIVAKTSVSLTVNVTLGRLASSTNDATITIPTGTTSFTRLRSSSFTALNGNASTSEAIVKIASQAVGTVSIQAARIIIIQNAATLTATQTQIEIGNNETLTATATQPLASPKYWRYNSANWDASLAFYAEATYANSTSSNSETFSASTTWTSPSGVYLLTAEAWGGGGAGGSNSSTADGAGGGSGGNYAKTTTSTASAATFTISVGNGGASSSAPEAGNPGGASYVTSTVAAASSSFVFATGGLGGKAPAGGGAGTGGATSTGSLGDTTFFGGKGGNGSDAAAGRGGGGGESGCTTGNGNNGGTGTGGGGSPGAGGTGCDGGDGGIGGGVAASGANGTAPGGGGGGSGEQARGGKGAVGQVKMSWTASSSIYLQEDNGAFGGWVNTSTIVSAGSATTPTRVRSSSFTPTNGRNYRIAARGNTSINIYNTKIIVDQAQGWSLVGSSSTISSAGALALAAFSSTRVAFIDDINDSLRAYDFDGSTWSLVGSGLTISDTDIPALAAFSSTRVAFIDGFNDSLRAYDFDGSTWSLVGSGLTIAGTGGPALAALSSSRVAFIDDANTSLRAYDFNGSTWSLVGSSSTLLGGKKTLAALSSSRVAITDDTRKTITAYDFNGSTWSTFGSSSTITDTGNHALAALSSSGPGNPSSSRVAFIDGNNESLRAYDFDGSTWSLVGSGLTISGPGAGFSALAALSSSRVAFIDSFNDSLRAYDFRENPTLFEPQYLLANTKFAAGTDLQNFLTGWDTAEWSATTTNKYLHQIDSAAGSASVAGVYNTSTVLVAGSQISSPSNLATSTMTMFCAAGDLDDKATTNNGDLYSSRILVQVGISGSACVAGAAASSSQVLIRGRKTTIKGGRVIIRGR